MVKNSLFRLFFNHTRHRYDGFLRLRVCNNSYGFYLLPYFAFTIKNNVDFARFTRHYRRFLPFGNRAATGRFAIRNCQWVFTCIFKLEIVCCFFAFLYRPKFKPLFTPEINRCWRTFRHNMVGR
ncbi:MAG: hypothetical protein RI894_384, partial [Bacteroidota bacterium]